MQKSDRVSAFFLRFAIYDLRFTLKRETKNEKRKSKFRTFAPEYHHDY